MIMSHCSHFSLKPLPAHQIALSWCPASQGMSRITSIGVGGCYNTHELLWHRKRRAIAMTMRPKRNWLGWYGLWVPRRIGTGFKREIDKNHNWSPLGLNIELQKKKKMLSWQWKCSGRAALLGYTVKLFIKLLSVWPEKTCSLSVTGGWSRTSASLFGARGSTEWHMI